MPSIYDGIMTDRELNTIRGKTMGNVATKDEILRVFQHLDCLEYLLDECDEVDALGTEGWRHRVGLED